MRFFVNKRSFQFRPYRASKGVICTRNQRGSATVEAAIILPFVILAFISILSIIRIVGTYGQVQLALNQVASDLSQYSYLYAVSGLKERHDTTVDHISDAKDSLYEQQNTVSSFYQSIQTLTGDVSRLTQTRNIDLDGLFETLQHIHDTNDSYEGVLKQVEDILQDPMEEARLISLALSDTLFGKSKTAVLGLISKSMLKSHLSKDLTIPMKDLNERLRIVNGIQGLDFSSSMFFNDKETIDLIVEYTVKPMPDFIMLPEIRLRNRACVLAWTWGVENSVFQTGQEIHPGESLWNIDKSKDTTGQHLSRGNTIDKQYAEELIKPLEHAEITPYHFKTIDVIEYAHSGKNGTLYTIFSLNPFLPTYHKKSAVVGVMKKNMTKLYEFNRYQVKDFNIDLALLDGVYQREVIVVIPENENIPTAYMEALEECRAYARQLNINLRQVQRYGEYQDESEPEPGTGGEDQSET